MKELFQRRDAEVKIASSKALKIVESRLDALDIEQNEKLGQHFLVDDTVLQRMAQEVEPGTNVIEIGSGVGQLTELLAQRADFVASIEIDRRYEAILQEIQDEYPNVELIYGDALSIRLKQLIKKLQAGEHAVQIVANLPYHIIEPFMQQAVGFNVPMSLMVGERFAQTSLVDDPENPFYSSLSLLSQAFFEVDRVLDVPREAFLPEPRTESAIMRFVPKSEPKHLSRQDFIIQRLFLTMNKSPLVKNVIKEALIVYADISCYGTRTKKESSRSNRRSSRQELKIIMREYQPRSRDSQEEQTNRQDNMTQNQARGIIDTTDLPETILNKPFSQLNNTEIQVLAHCLLGSNSR